MGEDQKGIKERAASGRQVGYQEGNQKRPQDGEVSGARIETDSYRLESFSLSLGVI